MICVLGMVCLCTSCTWQEAKEVIAVADSLDQTEHVIYDDTAALGRTIRSLDNPFGRKGTENGKLKGDYGFITWISRYTRNCLRAQNTSFMYASMN